MKSKKWIAMGLLIVAGTSVVRGENQYDSWDKNYMVQALLGGVKYDDLVFTNTDGTDSVTVDMSTLPQLGGAWSTLPKGEKLQFGMEGTFLLGFKFDDVNTYNSGGGGTYINVSSYLWLFDISGGVYGNLPLGSKLRLYAGAGPLMMIGLYNSESDTLRTSKSGTEFGFGAYARTGLELQVHRHGYLGVGVRGNWCNIDFSDVGGNSEISGIAAFITYTAGL